MASGESWSVARFALLSRFFVIALQILSNVLIPDHDAGVFNPPVTGMEKFSVVDKIIFFIFGGFRRWDAIYFLHIAQHGYTYENCVAFFPMYPLMVSTVKILTPLCPFMSESSLLLMFAVTLNVVVFIIAAVALLRLGQIVTQDHQLAYCAAVLFCINPASVFMTAPYTETLFACLSFGGMICVHEGKLLAGAVLIGGSAFTRSNGLVSIGFILHYCATKYIQRLTLVYGARHIRGLRLANKLANETVIYGVGALSLVVVSTIPFAGHQSYIYNLFCFPEDQGEVRASVASTIIEYGQERGYKVVGESHTSPWCFSPLPLSYSYIQSHHWGVGLLAYYTVKQIPNFILAAPVVTLSFCACYSYCCKNREACRVLGLMKTEKTKVETIGSHTQEEEKSGWRNPELVVYVLHLFFLTVFGCLFMHIQVVTRFLCSASPVIYWFAAYLLQPPSYSKWSESHFFDSSEPILLSTWWTLYSNGSAAGRCVLIFFMGYFVVGTVAFSNFLPWT
ncbi:GPI mannosyltransferase 2-like [Littorina saxatilis]|uniref:GPI mannosyltransferase 2 n=1 Tax=Littorina saxatilis TaxID=31220 RepID=A0AAN9B554_9CAEN